MAERRLRPFLESHPPFKEEALEHGPGDDSGVEDSRDVTGPTWSKPGAVDKARERWRRSKRNEGQRRGVA